MTASQVNSWLVFTSDWNTLPLLEAEASSLVYNTSVNDSDGKTLTYSLVNSINILVAGEKSNGKINIALFDEIAPLHSDRLSSLATDGAYDGIVFHRVIDGFMAQTGDVQFGSVFSNLVYAGTGLSSYDNLPAEFSDIPFDRGIVGMARSTEPDSANSQFFIISEDSHWLNEQYTVVGELASGFDVLDEIKSGDTSQNGIVLQSPDYMRKVTFTPAKNTFDIDATSGEIFLKDPIDIFKVDFRDLVVSVSDGSNTSYHTVALDLPSQFITVSSYHGAEEDSILPDHNLVLKSDTDTQVALVSGRLENLSDNLSFSHVEFTSKNYDHGIEIGDVILQLQNMVGLNALSDTETLAADINSDGEIKINDVISALRHITGLETIHACALIDNSSQIINSLGSSTIAELRLIQYGDVNLSATFEII